MIGSEDRVSTSAIFKSMRRSNGEVYMLNEVAEKFLSYIKSDELIIAEQYRIINELKTAFDGITKLQNRAAALSQKPEPEPESCS